MVTVPCAAHGDTSEHLFSLLFYTAGCILTYTWLSAAAWAHSPNSLQTTQQESTWRVLPCNQSQEQEGVFRIILVSIFKHHQAGNSLYVAQQKAFHQSDLTIFYFYFQDDKHILIFQNINFK